MSDVCVVGTCGVVVFGVFDGVSCLFFGYVYVFCEESFCFAVYFSVGVLCLVSYGVGELFVEVFCFLFVCAGGSVLEGYCCVWGVWVFFCL